MYITITICIYADYLHKYFSAATTECSPYNACKYLILLKCIKINVSAYFNVV